MLELTGAVELAFSLFTDGKVGGGGMRRVTLTLPKIWSPYLGTTETQKLISIFPLINADKACINRFKKTKFTLFWCSFRAFPLIKIVDI